MNNLWGCHANIISGQLHFYNSLICMKKFKLRKLIIGIFIFVTLINICAVISDSFANLYRKYVFHTISGLVSAIMSTIPFSFGELLIVLGILLCVYLFILFIIGIWIKSDKYRYIRKISLNLFIVCLLFIYVSESLNWYVLYAADTIENDIYKKQANEINNNTPKEDEEALYMLYCDTVNNLNELSVKFKRDEEGYISDSLFTVNECKEALLSISDEFDLLKGYYPMPKKIFFSGIMSQQYLAGIYFPFSFEANYNRKMYICNTPATICHELSHIKGYIREDEANFIAYVACTNSENEFIRYCGYLSVYYYVFRDFVTKCNYQAYDCPVINELVEKDDIFLKPEDFKRIEADSIFSTDVLSDSSEAFTDAYLKFGGVSSGMDSYSEVVRLLLLYKKSV